MRLIPRDEADLAQILRDASAPLDLRGGGTRGGHADRPQLVTTGFDRISLYEPGALTLVAQTGVPLSQIEALLAENNQRLPFEPMDHRAVLGTSGTPTLGGVLGLNVSGPRRVAAGAARDVVLGVRAVDGTGMVFRNGGRVMKNVTGTDLSRLMIGARGSLGVITEAALKVQAVPEATLTLRGAAADPEAAVALMSAALATPWEVNGAAWDGASVWLRIEGFETSVAYRSGRLTAHLPGTEEAPCDWTAIRDVTDFAAGDNAQTALWDVHLRPSDAPLACSRVCAAGGQVRLDWGGGRLWAQMPDGADLRGALAGIAGHATRLRGEGPGPRIPPEAAPVAALSAGLRARFDPRGILRPSLVCIGPDQPDPPAAEGAIIPHPPSNNPRPSQPSADQWAQLPQTSTKAR